MKYIILPIVTPILRSIGALVLLLVRIVFLIIANFVDFWNWKLEFLPEVWSDPFYDGEPTIAFRGTKYKVFHTCWDYITNKYEIRFTQ
jgi:hypothetical protein